MALADLSLPCSTGTGTPQAPCDAPGCPPCRGRRILRAVSDSRVRGDYQAAHQGRPPPHCRDHDSHTGACNACVSALAAPRRARKVDPTQPPHERVEQSTLAKWLRAKQVLWLHPPNEGMRDPIQGRYLRHLGMSPGAPDVLVLSMPAGGWLVPTPAVYVHGKEVTPVRGVAIELKRAKPAPSRVTPEQQAWLGNLDAQGWLVRVCYGAADAIQWLESIGRW